MPTRIAEDEFTVTMQGDDGQIYTVAKTVADKLFPMAEEGIPGLGEQPAVDVSPMAPPMQSVGRALGGVEPPPPSDALAVPDFAPPLEPEPEEAQFRPELQDVPPAPLEPPPAQLPQGLGGAVQLGGQGVAQQRAGIVRGATAEAAGAEQAAERLTIHGERIEDVEAEQRKKAAEDQAEMERRTVAYDAAVQEHADAKIDRGRMWSSRSTGQKLLAGIGVLLSGVGEAMAGRGGKNPAIDRIMSAIETDVRDQQAEVQKLGQGVALKKGQIQQFGELAESRMGQYNLAVAHGIAKVRRDIKQIEVSTTSEKVKANAMIADGRLQVEESGRISAAVQEERAYRMQVEGFEEKKRATKAAEKARRAQIGLGYSNLKFQKEQLAYKRQMDAEQAKAHVQAAIDKAKAKADAANEQGTVINSLNMQPIGVGKFGKVNLAEAVKAQEAVNAYLRLRSGLADYYAKMLSAGRTYQGLGNDKKFLQSQDAMELKSMFLDLATDYAKAKNGGKMTDEDVLQAKEIMGDGPQSIIQRADPKAIIRMMMERADYHHGNYLQGINIRVRDEAGQAMQNSPIYYMQQLDKQSQFLSEAPADPLVKEAATPAPARVLGLRTPDVRQTVASGAAVSSLGVRLRRDDKEAERALEHVVQNNPKMSYNAMLELARYKASEELGFDYTAQHVRVNPKMSADDFLEWYRDGAAGGQKLHGKDGEEGVTIGGKGSTQKWKTGVGPLAPKESRHSGTSSFPGVTK